MKRFLKALPVILVGGLALTGCSVAESPAPSTSFALEYSSHAEGDALGTTAADGTNVLGFQAVTTASQLAQLGLGGGEVKVDSTGDRSKQSAELAIGGFTSDSLNALTSSNAQQLQGLFQQWQAGDTSKTEADFFADPNLQSALQGYPGVVAATFLPTVTEENGAHQLTFTPSLVRFAANHNASMTLTAPGALTLAKEIPGVSVSGHEITIDASQLRSFDQFTVTYHDATPMMSWWLSAILWVLGLIVTVLLIVIALAPRRRD